MDLHHQFEVSAAVEDTWAAFLDMPRVAPCMPGAEITEVIDDRNVKGGAKVKVGPVNLRFAGTAEMVEIDEPNRTALMKAGGADAKGRGNADADVRFTLSEAGRTRRGRGQHIAEPDRIRRPVRARAAASSTRSPISCSTEFVANLEVELGGAKESRGRRHHARRRSSGGTGARRNNHHRFPASKAGIGTHAVLQGRLVDDQKEVQALVKPAPFTYHDPTTVDELVSLLSSLEDVKLLAGGQSLMPMLNLRLAQPDHLVDLNTVSGLGEIETTPDGVRVGAMVRQADLMTRRRPARQHADHGRGIALGGTLPDPYPRNDRRQHEPPRSRGRAAGHCAVVRRRADRRRAGRHAGGADARMADRLHDSQPGRGRGADRHRLHVLGRAARLCVRRVRSPLRRFRHRGRRRTSRHRGRRDHPGRGRHRRESSRPRSA